MVRDINRPEFIYGDAFDWLRLLAKKGRAFDAVVLDPPTFSQSKEFGAFRAEKDFGRLIAAALPVLAGKKSEREKFPGADITYTLEGLMGDARALQSCTSHNLGSNFAKSFDIRYLNRSNELEHVASTSWGLSTRAVGAILMTRV